MDILIANAAKYETADFLPADPSWFMHQVEGKRNQETFAFIASALSYGSRKQFFPKIQYVLDCSAGNVYEWVRIGEYAHDIPDVAECYYRLYTKHDMNVFLSRLKELLCEFGSLENFARQSVVDGDAFSLVEAITAYFRVVATPVIPKNATSSCKRVCMFLRWMVRDGSPVDLGLWSDFVDKRTLIMPMDTHVVQEACALGLLSGKSASMNAARKLTRVMAGIFPDDPLKGDFALFGYGVDADKTKRTPTK